MPILSDAASYAAGVQKLQELSAQKANLDSLVQGVVDAAQRYRQFRDGVDQDAADKTYADARLDEAIAEAKTFVDAMKPEDRVYFDKVIEGLGYTKNP